MATDGFVLIFYIPVLFGFLAFSVSYFIIDKKSAAPKSFTSIGCRRIVLGISGAMLFTLLLSCVSGISLAYGKVALGHISETELLQRAVGYCFYTFILFMPLVLAALVIAGIPILMLLAKAGFASHAGVQTVSALFGALAAARVYFWPYNNWCSSHMWQCVIDNGLYMLGFSAFVALGFSLGAQLPLFRSHGKNEN